MKTKFKIFYQVGKKYRWKSRQNWYPGMQIMTCENNDYTNNLSPCRFKWCNFSTNFI